MTRIASILLVVLLLLSAPVVAAGGGDLPAPAADKAQIVFLKPTDSLFGGIPTGLLELKGEGEWTLLSSLGAKSQLVVDVEPGTHTFAAATMYAVHLLDARVEAGKRYYVLVRFIYGAGFQLRPIRHAGSDYSASAPEFAGWRADTRPAAPTERELGWYSKKKEKLDKAIAASREAWTRKTDVERAELTLTPADAME